ncbi:MAG TPA: hypothetical protein VL463_35885 [Kofleriaceae bacterium]|jgi:hypothetical protein|nr:hypothetical protein [Kofleriaceae bacterium]
MTYRRDPHDDLHDSVDAFEGALRELAWQLAARVIADELSSRPAEDRRPRARRARATAPARAHTSEASAPAPVSAAPIADGKRMRWTRETVIAELCEWLISGIVEPAFLRRHGKPGLVPAATRIFGRFDSALNVANLYLAKQYPEGPPSKRAGAPVIPRAPRKARTIAAPSLASGSDPQIAMPLDAAIEHASSAAGESATDVSSDVSEHAPPPRD